MYIPSSRYQWNGSLSLSSRKYGAICKYAGRNDEKTLTEIAGTTDGNYFRATSNSKLKEVYEEIDKLEKTKLNVKEYSKRDEEYHWFALAAFLCVLLEVLLRNSVLKKIP